MPHAMFIHAQKRHCALRVLQLQVNEVHLNVLMVFTYKHCFSSNDVHKHNCFMSDLGNRDLRPHYDYGYADGHVLYYWQESNSKCLNFDAGHRQHKNPTSTESPNSYHLYKEDVPDLHFVKPTSGDTDHHVHYHYQTGGDSDGHTGSPDVHHQGGYNIWRKKLPSKNQTKCNTMKLISAESSSIFRRFTVNGDPCKRGTACERNPITGFWFCEAEGSEPGSWDYCCEPSHHCGFSEGHSYPW